MGLFFSDIPAPVRKVIARQRQVESQSESLHKLGCRACPFDSIPLNSPKMEATGSTQPLVYAIAEAPGQEEDERGIQLIGRSGQVFRTLLDSHQIYTTRFNNVINCRPPNNKTPVFKEIECCRSRVVNDILATKPKVILGLGAVPLKWFLGDISSGITEWRGRIVPVNISGHICWFVPTFHPAFLLRMRKPDRFGNERPSIYEEVFQRDVDMAYQLADNPPDPLFVHPPYDAGIELFTGAGGRNELLRLRSLLDILSKEQDVAFDYETNGLRPYRTGAKILSVSIGTYETVAAIALRHSQSQWGDLLPEVEEMYVDFLLKSGTKFAHNLNFEMEWTAVMFGASILRATKWGCTQAQAYVRDERKGVLSLDDVCLMNFGLHLKQLNKHLDKSHLDDYPLIDVLKYNALDAKYTHLAALCQQELIATEGLDGIYAEQIRRVPTVVLSQILGLNVDQAEVKSTQEALSFTQTEILTMLAESPDIKKFEARHGRRFNPASNPDLTLLFRDLLGFNQGLDINRKSGYSTDEEVLKQIDHPIAQMILELRNVAKLRSTYVEPLLLDSIAEDKAVFDDGRIHTIYNTTRTTTGRLSSDSPNIQNFPKRKDSWIRKQVVAPRSDAEFLPECFKP